ncbi:MAG: sigma-70 family RNA polymerase sigma factor [Bdellovibrionaceae bacterium]|nr:sigma-70 family RNA polymerase sigma factor [Pseudobdellovibrionaceae bacterium]
MKTETQSKPWLDVAGKPLSEAALKRASKNWDSETWEQYSKSIEGGIKEKMIKPYGYEQRCENMTRSIFDLHDYDEEKSRIIKVALQKLTRKQRQAIETYYFEGRTLADTADHLKISLDSLRDRLSGAFKKLRVLLGAYPSASPKVKGKEKSADDIFDHIDHHYQQGKLTKAERSRLWALCEVGGGLKGGESM